MFGPYYTFVCFSFSFIMSGRGHGKGGAEAEAEAMAVGIQHYPSQYQYLVSCKKAGN